MKTLLAVLLAVAAVRASAQPVTGGAPAQGAASAFSASSVTVSGTGSKCFSADDPTLVVDCGNHRVGIGTASPNSKLHLSSGTLTVDGNVQPMLSIGGPNADGNIKSTTDLYLDTVRDTFIRQGPTFVATNVTIKQNGNVGIGTASPSFSKLHVVNTGAGVQTNTILDNEQAAAADVGSDLTFTGVGVVTQGTVRSAWQGAATTDAYTAILTRGSNTVSEKIRVLGNGNVGIGTASPATTLDVVGVIRSSTSAGAYAQFAGPMTNDASNAGLPTTTNTSTATFTLATLTVNKSPSLCLLYNAGSGNSSVILANPFGGVVNVISQNSTEYSTTGAAGKTSVSVASGGQTLSLWNDTGVSAQYTLNCLTSGR